MRLKDEVYCWAGNVRRGMNWAGGKRLERSWAGSWVEQSQCADSRKVYGG